MVKIIRGSRVEVMRPSRGFENSYFGARVIKKHQNMVLVRYEELIDDKGELLVEGHRIEHVRPYPPRVDHILSEGDDVDAWDGAGKSPMRKNMFEYTRNARILVVAQHGSNMQHYEPGTRVEVIGHDDEYVNSYYAATVLLSHQNNVIVLYDQCFNPNGQLLEEEVYKDHIRPYPPDVDHYLNEGDNSISLTIPEIVDTSHVQDMMFAYIKNGLIMDVHLHGCMLRKALSPQTIINFKLHKILIIKVSSVTAYKFQVGDRVEVLLHKIGFENSYHAAAVLYVLEESLIVMYEALVDVNHDAYQEEVKLQDIRPYPPTVLQHLTVGDDVDVWEQNGDMVNDMRKFLGMMSVSIRNGWTAESMDFGRITRLVRVKLDVCKPFGSLVKPSKICSIVLRVTTL
ncbi:hypothetical protein LXL04_020614 [Taraxacum kok-saghyz]